MAVNTLDKLQFLSSITFIAHSTNLPSELYVLPVLISFSFLKDFLEPIYLRIYWTDFHTFFTKAFVR